MELLANWTALQRAVGTIPRSAPGYSTNLYATSDQVHQWIAEAPLRILDMSGALLVLRSDRDFEHVYHVAENPPALIAALASLPSGRYATDLIGRGAMLDQVCSAYGDAGFRHHASLIRMGRAQTSKAPAVHEDALCATTDDVPEVAAFLERLLDRFTEQLPSFDELCGAAMDGRLLVVRRASAISGMLMYDIKGQLGHLRFWHVDPSAQGMGVGRRLMTGFLTRCVALRRIVLWVIGDNDRSIEIYRHYGFAADGLLDRIMVMHRDSQE